MEKKALTLLLILVLSFLLPLTPAASQNTIVLVEGKQIQTSAIIQDGNLYLPLRAVCEVLGYNVQWSSLDGSVTLAQSDKSILLDYPNHQITKLGHTFYMEGEYYGDPLCGSSQAGDVKYMRQDFFSDNLALRITWDRAKGEVRIESIKENELAIRNVKETAKTDNLTLTLQYPQIEGLPDKQVQDKLNAAFRDYAMQAKTIGQQNADELAKLVAEGYGGSQQCETYFDYRVKYNQHGLLSLAFTDYQYAGGAHGGTVQSSHTYNLTTGAELKLKDFFVEDADYVAAINHAINRGIAERVKAGILPEQPLTPFESIKADQDFYLENNGIGIYFQQYEHYPYAVGIQEFITYYAELKDILQPNYTFFNL